MEVVKLLPSNPSFVITGVAKGVFAAGTTYAVGEVVTYNGGTYMMHTLAAAGTLPTDTTAWQAMSSPQAYVESLAELSLVNATTDNTISIDQNGNVGTAVATDGALHIENTGNTGIGLGVYTNIGATADASLIKVHADNIDFDQNVFEIINDGSAAAVKIDQNGNNVGLQIDAENTTGDGVQILCDAVTTGTVLFVRGANGSASNNILLAVEGTGSSKGASISLSHATNANSGVLITHAGLPNAANGALNIEKTNAGGGYAIRINNDGTGESIFIDHDDNGANPSINIDRDGNNAGRIFGIKITVDNAGVGNLVGGIDFSGMSDGEPLFKLTSTDVDLSAKSPETDAEAGWFPVDVAGTVYAVPIYALS